MVQFIPARNPAARRQLWHELDMLCRLGLGLAPIAVEVCAALGSLVGADAAALFWLDDQGLPAGFFHEDSPASTQDLFLNEFKRLFVGAHGMNVLAQARPDGPRVGRLLSPDARHFRSNTYNLLVRSSGHHHVLDMRVEVDGHRAAPQRDSAAKTGLLSQSEHHRQVRHWPTFNSLDPCSAVASNSNESPALTATTFAPYQSAHAAAFVVYARLQVYEALTECEGAMGRAMLMAQRVPLEPDRQSLALNLPEARMALVWEELKAMADDVPGVQEMPPEAGVLSLGPFATRIHETHQSISVLARAR